MPFAINDNGTWRYPKVLSKNDATTWRQVKFLQVNDGGVWRVPASYIGNMTIAKDATFDLWGYEDAGTGSGHGDISPNTEANGFTIFTLYFLSGNFTQLQFTGAVGAVTQSNYLKLVTVDGVSVNTSLCSFFSNNGTDLVFRWSGDLFSLQAKNGTKVSVQFTPP
jgi:hypothetical protein